MLDPPAATPHTPAVRGGCFSSALFAVLLVAGAVIFWTLFHEPWGLFLAARSWEKTPCTVFESALVPIPGDAKGTFTKRRLEFRYSYSYRGQIYRSSNVWFIKPDSEEARRLIQKYPKGTETECWVNPASPAEAYLLRGFRAELLLALFPLALVVVGLIGLLWQLVQRLRASRAAGDGFGDEE